jgi:hypothetical protein
MRSSRLFQVYNLNVHRRHRKRYSARARGTQRRATKRFRINDIGRRIRRDYNSGVAKTPSQNRRKSSPSSIRSAAAAIEGTSRKFLSSFRDRLLVSLFSLSLLLSRDASLSRELAICGDSLPVCPFPPLTDVTAASVPHFLRRTSASAPGLLPASPAGPTECLEKSNHRYCADTRLKSTGKRASSDPQGERFEKSRC